eukprot:scaffold128885_cov41-Tisochrysis_lutea.AAC.2
MADHVKVRVWSVPQLCRFKVATSTSPGVTLTVNFGAGRSTEGKCTRFCSTLAVLPTLEADLCVRGQGSCSMSSSCSRFAWDFRSLACDSCLWNR